MALSATAGWIVKSFIKSLIDKAVETAASQLAQQQGIGDNIRSLKSSLVKVRFALRLAEERQTKDLFLIKEKELHRLLCSTMKELKLVAYEAEDLFDDVNYDILKQKIKHDEGEENWSAGNFSMSSVATYFKNLFSSNAENKATNVRSRAADIDSRLDKLAVELKELLLLLPMDNSKKKRKLSITPSRETSSYSYETKLLGRQEEFQNVVNILIDGVGTSGDNFSVLVVYGTGGVGKTTLAQFVYNDKRVKDYFDLAAWVCVSDCFDERRITKEIVESLINKEQTNVNLNSLQSTLEEKIMLKKLLIVMDDMWDEDKHRWEKLCAPLRCAAPGTKILLTTRLQTVANKVGSRGNILLKGLKDDDFWQLFEKCAFGCSNLEQNTILMPLGRKIAEKLNGSPLAAKTVGSMLRSNLSTEHCRTIMESKLLELPQTETDILPSLRLSYEYLPGHLKECFSYWSLFPKGYEIPKDKLVYIWMSLGLILPQNNLQIKDVGFRYIDDLISSCFFENIFYDDSKIKMHDLIHELAEFVSKDENLRMENCTLTSLGSIVHLSLNIDHLEPQGVKAICNKHNKLRTLMIPNRYKWVNIGLPLDGALFLSLRSIRTLTLASCGIKELPDNIGNLKYLRYLDISRNDIEILPEAICSLYNLQYLDISELRLHTVPIRMYNLINLSVLNRNSLILVAS